MRDRTKKMGLVAIVAVILVVCFQVIRFVRNYHFIRAAESGPTDNVERYLRLGADVNSRVYKGLSALDVAAYAGNVDTVNLLLKHGANPKTALGTATLKKNAATVKILIANGATIDDVAPSLLEDLKSDKSPLAKKIQTMLNASHPVIH